MRAGARQDGSFIHLSAAAPGREEGDDRIEDTLEDTTAFVEVVRVRKSAGGEVEVECTGRTRWAARWAAYTMYKSRSMWKTKNG